jgi:hypothetical protein
MSRKILRRIFGPTRKVATRGWRKLHNERIHSLLALLKQKPIIRMIKYRRKRWAQHMT